MMKSVTVVIPTYNECENIVPLAKDILLVLKKYQSSIIVVDDNSPDGTGKVAKEFADTRKDVKVIVRKERGLGSAVGRGIEEAKSDIIVVLDSDYSHPPNVIPKLVDALEDADIVFASRYAKGGGMEGSKLQYYLSVLFNYSIKVFLGIPIVDSTGGFFAVKRKALDAVNSDTVFAGYGDYCFKLIYGLKGKAKMKEIPFHYQPRRAGTAKTNLMHAGITYWREAIKLRLK